MTSAFSRKTGYGMITTDWDDIRFLLAVARKGTLSGAARLLGVNHATVLRRVNGFENSLGVTVFDRTARGYRLAPGREKLLNAILEMEETALKVERALSAARTPLSGVVRVASTDTLCVSVLPRVAKRIMADQKGLEIELIADNDVSNLGRLEADIAVRVSHSLQDDLIGECVGTTKYAIYAAPDGSTRWLGMGGLLANTKPGKWMNEQVGRTEIVARAGSFPILREMVAAGHGKAVLPQLLANDDPRLVRLPEDLPPMEAGIWVTSHVDMADVPRIKAVRDMLIDALPAAL